MLDISTWIKSLLFLITVLFGLSGIGQSKLDSLSQEINSEINTSKKAKLLLERALLYDKSESNKAFKDIEEALEFYRNTGNKEGEVDSYIAYGNLHFWNRNPPKAAHFDSLATALAEKISYKKGRATAVGNLAREFITTGNFKIADSLLIIAINIEENLSPLDRDRLAELYNRTSILKSKRGDNLESLLAIEKAADFAEGSTDNILLSNVYINYANTLSRLTRFDEAVKMHFKVIRLNEKLNNENGLMRAYNNLGIAFKNAGEYEKALMYYNKSLAIGKRLNEYKSMGLTLVNMATVYSALEEFSGIDTLYIQGIKYFEEISDLGGIAFANHNYGNSLVVRKNYIKADTFLLKAYKLRKQIGAELAAASSQSILGKSAFEQNKLKEAETHLLAAETAFYGKNREDRNLKELYGLLKELYTKKGNFEKALYYQTNELDLERTLFTENEKVNTLKTETTYLLEKRDMEMALQNKKQQLVRDRMIFGGGSVVLILLLISLSLWQRRKQLKERHQSQIITLDQQHRLTLTRSLKNAEQEERKKIAHKLHDETGAMLSIALLNLKQFKNDLGVIQSKVEDKLTTTQKLLGEISENVRSISHTLMPVALEKYGLKPAIHDLVSAVNTSEKLKVEEIFEGLENTNDWSEEFCLTVYRIVQEVMNNIIKHAQASHVLLQIVELEDSVTIYIEDNGTGIKQDIEQEGTGLRMLKSNVAYLNGTLEINGNQNSGTFILAELPIEKKEITN
ncbi:MULTISPECIES: ATP-binding protein [Aequorivita]|uniref:histidine kinase n=2 Tax=Aequorivita TaxID=153265 RepID=A0AB35YTV2_9FLAO|nr:sensor histidine kinase [Aequorivita sp. Ant34-E75]WGF91935.1 sensor histidine kinase [Aequorivita sp. Ant34-E75]